MKRNYLILYALLIALVSLIEVARADPCAQWNSLGSCMAHNAECTYQRGNCVSRNPANRATAKVQAKPEPEILVINQEPKVPPTLPNLKLVKPGQSKCLGFTAPRLCIENGCEWKVGTGCVEVNQEPKKLVKLDLVKDLIKKLENEKAKIDELEKEAKQVPVMMTTTAVKQESNAAGSGSGSNGRGYKPNHRGYGNHHKDKPVDPYILQKGVNFDYPTDSMVVGNGIQATNKIGPRVDDGDKFKTWSAYTKPVEVCAPINNDAECTAMAGCQWDADDSECLTDAQANCAFQPDETACNNAPASYNCIYVKTRKGSKCVLGDSDLRPTFVDCTQYKDPKSCRGTRDNPNRQCEWHVIAIKGTGSEPPFPKGDGSDGGSGGERGIRRPYGHKDPDTPILTRKNKFNDFFPEFKYLDGICRKKPEKTQEEICNRITLEADCDLSDDCFYKTFDDGSKKCVEKLGLPTKEFVSKSEDWGLKRYQRLQCSSFKQDLCDENFYMCVWNSRTYTCHDRNSQAATRATECSIYSMQECLSYNKDCVWDYKTYRCSDGYDKFWNSNSCSESRDYETCNVNSFACRWDPYLYYCFPRTPLEGVRRQKHTLANHVFPYPCRPKGRMELFLQGRNLKGSIFTQMDYYREYDNLFRSRATKFFLGRFGLDFTTEDYFQGAMMIPFKLRDDLFASILDNYIDAPHMSVPLKNRVLIDGYRVFSAPRSVAVLGGSYSEYMGEKSVKLLYEQSLLYLELRIVDEFGQVYHQLEISYPYPVLRDDDISIVPALGDVFHNELGRGVIRQVEVTEPDAYVEVKRGYGGYGKPPQQTSNSKGGYGGYRGDPEPQPAQSNGFRKPQRPKKFKKISRIHMVGIITFQECDYYNPSFAQTAVPVGAGIDVAYGAGPAHTGYPGSASPLINGNQYTSGTPVAGGAAYGGAAGGAAYGGAAGGAAYGGAAGGAAYGGAAGGVAYGGAAGGAAYGGAAGGAAYGGAAGGAAYGGAAYGGAAYGGARGGAAYGAGTYGATVTNKYQLKQSGFAKSMPTTYTPDYTVTHSRQLAREKPSQFYPGLGIRSSEWAAATGRAPEWGEKAHGAAPPPLVQAPLIPTQAPSAAPLATNVPVGAVPIAAGVAPVAPASVVRGAWKK